MERAAAPASGFWHRTALAAMRRPLLAGAGVLTVLLVAAAPVLGLPFGLPDERALPEGTSSRTTSEIVHREFAAEPTDTVQVVLAEPADTRVTPPSSPASPGVFRSTPPRAPTRTAVAPEPPARTG